MGTGASTGAIDLPHSREASTGLPNAPGSGIKGVLRDELRYSKDLNGKHKRLFGAAWDDVTDRDQGALLFSDALLLCLPVPSYGGGFAWVTSPTVLSRHERESKACGLASLGGLPKLADETAACAPASPLLVEQAIFLHDVKLTRDEQADAQAKSFAEGIANRVFASPDERQAFIERFLIVPDDVLDYLARVAMDIRTRISVEDSTKTVRRGGLWTEENLPSETLLWGSLAADTLTDSEQNQLNAKDAMEAFRKACGGRRRLQLGGKATVGRGLVILSLQPDR
jgi:CRISPR-associated protein Cmr4